MGRLAKNNCVFFLNVDTTQFGILVIGMVTSSATICQPLAQAEVVLLERGRPPGLHNAHTSVRNFAAFEAVSNCATCFKSSTMVCLLCFCTVTDNLLVGKYPVCFLLLCIPEA